MGKPKNDIYQIIATKYGLHKSVIEAVVRSQFSFVKEVVCDPDDERTIMLPRIGKFIYKERLKGTKRSLHDARQLKYAIKYGGRSRKPKEENIDN